MLVERRKSKIHGDGVFAMEDFEPGDWQYIYGEIIPFHPCLEHYCIEADNGMFLLYEPFSWMNHSADPNCEITSRGGIYYIEVIKPIKKNQELVIDYGYTP